MGHRGFRVSGTAEPLTGRLPEHARRMLMEASATSASLDNFERRKAVDAAIERVRRLYPQYFREDRDADHSGGQ